MSWHSSALRILFFISLLAESRLRAAHFSSLNITIIWKSSWKLSHLSDFPLIFHQGESPLCLLHRNIQFLSLIYFQWFLQFSLKGCERGEANKYGRGSLWIYNFCCWQSSKSVSVLTWSFQRISWKGSIILSELCSTDTGWTMKTQSTPDLPKCNSSSARKSGSSALFLLWATAGRSCKGHCNILVPAGTVYFVFHLWGRKVSQSCKGLKIWKLSCWTSAPVVELWIWCSQRCLKLTHFLYWDVFTQIINL